LDAGEIGRCDRRHLGSPVVIRRRGKKGRLEIAFYSDEELERIFERFHQYDASATRAYGGAGLGLTISRTIVRHLGGDLWAESTEGQGSRFYVRLRLVTRDRTTPVPAAPVGPPHRSVLLLEQDTDRQELWRMQFGAAGWRVTARRQVGCPRRSGWELLGL